MGDFDSIGAGKMIKASPPLLLLLLLLFCLGVATPAAGAVRMAPVFNPVLFEKLDTSNRGEKYNLDFCFTFHAKCPPGLNYWARARILIPASTLTTGACRPRDIKKPRTMREEEEDARCCPYSFVKPLLSDADRK